MGNGHILFYDMKVRNYKFTGVQYMFIVLFCCCSKLSHMKPHVTLEANPQKNLSTAWNTITKGNVAKWSGGIMALIFFSILSLSLSLKMYVHAMKELLYQILWTIYPADVKIVSPIKFAYIQINYTYASIREGIFNTWTHSHTWISQEISCYSNWLYNGKGVSYTPTTLEIMCIPEVELRDFHRRVGYNGHKTHFCC